MPTLDQMRFDTTGWELNKKDALSAVWQKAKDGMRLDLTLEVPQIRIEADDVLALRAFYKKKFNKDGFGLISLDVVKPYDLPVTKRIIRSRIPNQRLGLLYLGTYIFLFATFSFQIEVMTLESNTTGMREATVMDRAIKEGEVEVNANKTQVVGWVPDPHLDMNRAEEEEFDEEFPDHPLSRVRSYLDAIWSTLELDTEILNAPRFVPKKKGLFGLFAR